MSYTTLTIKTQKKLRDDVKRVARNLGIPLTTAMNAMMRQLVRERRIVLEEECPFPSHTPNAATRRALKDLNNRKNMESMTFDKFADYVRSIG